MTKAADEASRVDALIGKYGTGHRPGMPCATNESGKASLIAALHERGVQWARISEILRAEFNLTISPTMLSRHHFKRCACPR